MIRLILGILLSLWALLMFVGAIASGELFEIGSVLIILLFCVPGVLLIVYGSRAYRKRRGERAEQRRERERSTAKRAASSGTKTEAPEPRRDMLPVEKILEDPACLKVHDYRARYDRIMSLRSHNSPESSSVLRTFQASHLSTEKLITVPDCPLGLAFCLRRNLYAAYDVRKWRIHICELDVDEKVNTLMGWGGECMTMSFSPDGSLLVVGSYVQGHAEHVSLFDFDKATKPNKQYHRSTGVAGVFAPSFIVPTWGTRHVVFSPDSKSIAIGAENGDVSVLGLDKEEPMKMSTSGHLAPHDLRYSHNGRLLAQMSYGGGRAWSSSENCTVKVWEVGTGEEIYGLSGGVFPIGFKSRSRICFSHDDKYLAGGGHELDKSIKIWEVSSGQMLASFDAHEHAITGLLFSGDNHHLISGSLDGTVKLWAIMDSQGSIMHDPALVDQVLFRWDVTGWESKPQGITALLLSSQDNEIIAVFPAGTNKYLEPDQTGLLYLKVPSSG